MVLILLYFICKCTIFNVRGGGGLEQFFEGTAEKPTLNLDLCVTFCNNVDIWINTID